MRVLPGAGGRHFIADVAVENARKRRPKSRKEESAPPGRTATVSTSTRTPLPGDRRAGPRMPETAPEIRLVPRDDYGAIHDPRRRLAVGVVHAGVTDPEPAPPDRIERRGLARPARPRALPRNRGRRP